MHKHKAQSERAYPEKLGQGYSPARILPRIGTGIEGGNYFVPYLEQGHKGWLIWDKGQRGLTMSDCELAYTSFHFEPRCIAAGRDDPSDAKAREAVFVGSFPVRPKGNADT